MPAAMRSDREAARRLLRSRSRRRRNGAGRREQLVQMAARLAASVERKRRRRSQLPDLPDNPVLPIYAHKHEIIDAINAHPVVIVAGQTGSGKTTQLPKYCLAAGRGVDGQVGCTQPRRIAASSVAYRIAEELGQEPGRTVGYRIRFQDRSSPDAFIKLMTDGILLAEAQRDPTLDQYDTLIIDEAHERSLNIDFILGLLKVLLRRRDDLKVVITSATIDTEKFSQAFGGAPVIEVSGRLYPVAVHYAPPDPPAENAAAPGYLQAAVTAFDDLQQKSPPGDVLIFMPTEQDIRETCELISARRYPALRVLPLYARLPADRQRRVFARQKGRKVIVATNVAETAITIPGIRYVIDTGMARISRFSPRTRTTSLPIVPIARSSADQRMGRCGRVADGVCIRLYSEEDYLARPLYTTPEIKRTNLAEVILRMMALRLGDIAAFPFIDRPNEKSIRDGFRLLEELGAIEKTPRGRANPGGSRTPAHRLSARGRMMARLPLDPRLARMLLQAREEGCLPEMTALAAVLSIADPRERPLDRRGAADAAHARFVEPSSDFVTLLNIWRAYGRTRRRERPTAALKRFCTENYLSFKRMREWQDIHDQIAAVLRDNRMTPAPKPARAGKASPGVDHGAIHRAVLSGFLSNIAVRKEKNVYRAAKNREAMIFPGSGLFDRGPNWLVAAEMVETSRLFARTCGAVDSQWIPPLAGSLCRSTYLEPHWERRREQVVARHQISLFGLILAADQKVAYGPVDPEVACDLFIRSALVAGDLRRLPPFLKHNRELIDRQRQMEEKIRRRDILITDEELVDFYRQRLGGVYDLPSLQQRIRQKGGDAFLRLGPDDLLRYRPDPSELAQFPDQIDIGGHRLSCRYRFDPGSAKDGLTVKVPQALASQLQPETLDRLVPGLYREKIAALIRSLPKVYRRQLVPIPGTVAIICSEMALGRGSLLTTLAAFIHQRFSVDIPAEAWRPERLPDHLKTRLAVIDASGRTLRSSRHTDVLKTDPDEAAALPGLGRLKRRWERRDVTDWDFGNLPESVPLTHQGRDVARLFPMLKCTGEAVDLVLCLDPERALAGHRLGVAALLRRRLKRELAYLKRTVSLSDEARRWAGLFGGAAELEKGLRQHLGVVLLSHDIRTAAEFERTAVALQRQLSADAARWTEAAGRVVAATGKVSQTLSKLALEFQASPVLTSFLAELGRGVQRLVSDRFYTLYTPDRMARLECYLAAVAVRARRGMQDLEKDRKKAAQVAQFEQPFQELLTQVKGKTASAEKRRAVEDFFWLLEEYKVSVYAQELKTAVPVSKKRLQARLEAVQRMV
jgi:ATP-dependent helicase HrpA